MSMSTTLGEVGFFCPHCGEFIENDELDCGDIQDLELHGYVYFICPFCEESFWIENCDENSDN